MGIKDEKWWAEFRDETLREAEKKGIAAEAKAYFEGDDRFWVKDEESAQRDYEGFENTIIGMREGKSPEELSADFMRPVYDALGGKGSAGKENPFCLLVALPGDLELPTATAFGEAVRAARLDSSAKLNTTPGAAPMLASVLFGNHRIGLEGNPVPLGKFQPGLLENTLQVAHTKPGPKLAFKENRSYYTCRYVGDSEDPLERWLALHAVAAAFLNVGCLGVLNPAAHNFLPPESLEAFGDAELVAGLEKNLPDGLFTNVVHNFFPDGGTLCVSYGNQFFGLPELAHYVREGQNPAAGNYLLNEFTNYMYSSGKRIKLGERIRSGDTVWVAGEFPDELKYLADPENASVFLIEPWDGSPTDADKNAGGPPEPPDPPRLQQDLHAPRANAGRTGCLGNMVFMLAGSAALILYWMSR